MKLENSYEIPYPYATLLACSYLGDWFNPVGQYCESDVTVTVGGRLTKGKGEGIMGVSNMEYQEGPTRQLEKGWYWVSACRGEEFVGAAVLECWPELIFTGLTQARQSGLFPEDIDDVLMIPIPNEVLDKFPPADRNRLLEKDEIMSRMEWIRLGDWLIGDPE